MKCARFDYGVICGPDAVDQVVTVQGKPVRFDFDEWLGPTVLGKTGKPLAQQPGEFNPFWPEFRDWFDRRRGLAPECRVCGGSGLVKGEQVAKRHWLTFECGSCGGKGRVSR